MKQISFEYEFHNEDRPQERFGVLEGGEQTFCTIYASGEDSPNRRVPIFRYTRGSDVYTEDNVRLQKQELLASTFAAFQSTLSHSTRFDRLA